MFEVFVDEKENDSKKGEEDNVENNYTEKVQIIFFQTRLFFAQRSQRFK